MHPEFWHQRWMTSQIGFHEQAVNPLLVEHFDAVALPHGSRVFVPLCGMTLDIDWLLARGHRVAGAELSPLAVAQLFKRLALEPEVEQLGGITHYSAAGVDIFEGDIFRLRGDVLGMVDGVYDRAALVALPPGMRPGYARHLHEVSRGAPQLLVTLEYNQALVQGPPFSVDAAEVRALYPHGVVKQLASVFHPTGLKGRFPVTEVAWIAA